MLVTGASPFNPLSGNALVSRDAVQRAVRDLFDPLVPRYLEGGARVRLGGAGAEYDEVAQQLEAFARPLWGIVPLAAGGGAFPHWDLIRAGLVGGTDPNHPDYWGHALDHDQRSVEMAAIGFALALVPQHVWDPLGQAERSRLVSWLRGAEHRRLYANNWQFFRVLVGLGLRRVGVAPNAGRLAESLDSIERDYVDDGWYRDGEEAGTFDHYAGWAYHFYGLIYAALAGEGDPERARRYRERARLFADAFQHWFDPVGRVVPYGRSVTYRFAAASFWGALAFAGEEALPWGRMKGLYLRHLREWSTRTIADASGVLRVGYGYDNLCVSESYNGPGSPYWAFKAFLPLALPSGHPFWASGEEPLPPLDGSMAQPTPGMLLSRDDSQAQMLCGGRGRWTVRQGAAKYGKFAYSSLFGFSVEMEDSVAGGVTDSTLMLWQADGQRRVRHRVDACSVGRECLYSRWRPWPDIAVDTVLFGRSPWHVRIHRIRSPRALRALETGFAVGWDGRESGAVEVRKGVARVRTSGGLSAVLDLRGGREGRLLKMAPNANIIVPLTLVPALGARLDAGEHLLMCAVLATNRPDEAIAGSPPAVPAEAWELLEAARDGR